MVASSTSAVTQDGIVKTAHHLTCATHVTVNFGHLASTMSREGHKFARVKREEDEGRCETCKQTFDRYHRDFAEVCVTCGDDYNNICEDCMIDSGKSCDRCDIFKCYPCQDQSSGLDFCEECYNYFCDSCMKMRPYKGDAHICGECFAKKPSWKLPANFGSEKMPLAERKVFSDIAKAYEDSGETRRVG